MSHFNINHEEIAKFNQHAAHWWDTQGELKTLHDINPVRLAYIQQHAVLNGKSVLDIGCGGGILSESMALLGANVTGIDMSENALEAAREHQKISKTSVSYYQQTAEAFATDQAASFDIITCLELLEHVPDPRSVIQACAQLLKPSGQLFFSTLNRNSKSYLFAILGAEYLLKMLPKNTHDFASFIRPSELSKWARQSCLYPSDITGISYNIFTRAYALSSDVSVNYMMYLKKV